jgi:hypothetical protein
MTTINANYRPKAGSVRNTPQDVQAARIPVLQWANGKTMAKVAGAARFAGLVGFHAERGRDADFDAVCEAQQIGSGTIRHMTSGEKSHWLFGETVSFHPLTKGPPATTISGCLKVAEQTALAGLRLRWPSGLKSSLSVRGYLSIGDAYSFVQLGVSSTMTAHLLAALLDHYRVCVAADSLITDPDYGDVAYSDLALLLGPGEEEQAGKGETVTTLTPLRSGHPEQITRDYVRGIWRPSSLPDWAAADWEETVVWAFSEKEEGLGER